MLSYSIRSNPDTIIETKILSLIGLPRLCLFLLYLPLLGTTVDLALQHKAARHPLIVHPHHFIASHIDTSHTYIHTMASFFRFPVVSFFVAPLFLFVPAQRR